MNPHTDHPTCPCCGDVSRRDFLAGTGLAAGSLTLGTMPTTLLAGSAASRKKEPARVQVAFVYPPSTVFSEKPDGWWSWPGNEFDAEARQKQYTGKLRASAKRLGVRLEVEPKSIASDDDVKRLTAKLAADRPDGMLLILFYNRSLHHADALLAAAEKQGIPAVFYIGLGVKHGAITAYRRPGVYFIQSLDNFEALERGLRMIHVRKRMGQSLLLSINEAKEPREGREQFFGTTVRVIPFRQYAAAFHAVKIDGEALRWIERFKAEAKEVRGLSAKAMENATRAHLALKKLLADEGADGLTMNCLKRGMLKPCVSFASLNNELIPAACENDLPAVYTQLLGQLLLGRPGFQHNPCYETERNHYYASHCTCPSRLYGPGGSELPFLLRRFAHTNEGSCAIQVFWKPGDAVTMVRYYPSKSPKLDVYAGEVVVSHPMPPAGGCTTNVEIKVTDRADACMVRGHHNLLFAGDFARDFRRFANLHKIGLARTGYAGPAAG